SKTNIRNTVFCWMQYSNLLRIFIYIMLLSSSQKSPLVLLSFVGSTVLVVVALLHHQFFHPSWWIHENRWVKLLLQLLEQILVAFVDATDTLHELLHLQGLR